MSDRPFPFVDGKPAIAAALAERHAPTPKLYGFDRDALTPEETERAIAWAVDTLTPRTGPEAERQVAERVVAAMTARPTEAPCECGGACQWASEEWYDAAGEIESWDHYCERCGRWRKWELDEYDEGRLP